MCYGPSTGVDFDLYSGSDECGRQYGEVPANVPLVEPNVLQFVCLWISWGILSAQEDIFADLPKSRLVDMAIFEPLPHRYRRMWRILDVSPAEEI